MWGPGVCLYGVQVCACTESRWVLVQGPGGCLYGVQVGACVGSWMVLMWVYLHCTVLQTAEDDFVELDIVT